MTYEEEFENYCELYMQDQSLTQPSGYPDIKWKVLKKSELQYKILSMKRDLKSQAQIILNKANENLKGQNLAPLLQHTYKRHLKLFEDLHTD